MTGNTFLVIGHFPLVVLGHLRRIDAGIPNVAPNLGISISLIGDGSKEGGAAGPRAAQNKAHFTWLEDAR